MLSGLSAKVPEWEKLPRTCLFGAMGAVFDQPQCATDLCQYNTEIYPKGGVVDPNQKWWDRQVKWSCGAEIPGVKKCGASEALVWKANGHVVIPDLTSSNGVVSWSDGNIAQSTFNYGGKPKDSVKPDSKAYTTISETIQKKGIDTTYGDFSCSSPVSGEDLTPNAELGLVDCQPSLYCQKKNALMPPDVTVGFSLNGTDILKPDEKVYVSDFLTGQLKVFVKPNEDYIDIDREEFKDADGTVTDEKRFYVKFRVGLSNVLGITASMSGDLTDFEIYDDGGKQCPLVGDEKAGDGVFSGSVFPVGLIGASAPTTHCIGDALLHRNMNEIHFTLQQFKSYLSYGTLRLTALVYRKKGSIPVASISMPFDGSELIRPGAPSDFLNGLIKTNMIAGKGLVSEDPSITMTEIGRALLPLVPEAARPIIERYYQQQGVDLQKKPFMPEPPAWPRESFLPCEGAATDVSTCSMSTVGEQLNAAGAGQSHVLVVAVPSEPTKEVLRIENRDTNKMFFFGGVEKKDEQAWFKTLGELDKQLHKK